MAGGIGADGSLKDLKDLGHAGDRIGVRVPELDHGELDHLVLGRIEAGGLGVEDDAGLAGLAFARRARRARHKPAKDFVVAARLEGGGHPVQIFWAVQRIGVGGVEHGGFRGCC